jgi:multidrug resistance efflux pump
MILWFSILAVAAGARGADSSGSEQASRLYEEAFQGKLVCSLKRTVVMHLKGTVSQLRVQVGQRVKQGEVLAAYRVSSDMVVGLKRRIAAVQVRDLEVALTELEKNLAALYGKRRELTQLAGQNLAPAEGLKQVEREVQAAEKHRTAIQEKLRIEREVVRDDIEALREQMGGSLKAAEAGELVNLIAPIAGHVIWINPEMRVGAELPPGTGAFVMGVMDPMLMKAQVHELEAVKISVGDLADVTFESLPGRVFEAKVSRLSWSPVTAAVEQPSYYELELTVANQDLTLREGLKGQATFRRPSAN